MSPTWSSSPQCRIRESYILFRFPNKWQQWTSRAWYRGIDCRVCKSFNINNVLFRNNSLLMYGCDAFHLRSGKVLAVFQKLFFCLLLVLFGFDVRSYAFNELRLFKFGPRIPYNYWWWWNVSILPQLPQNWIYFLFRKVPRRPVNGNTRYQYKSVQNRLLWFVFLLFLSLNRLSVCGNDSSIRPWKCTYLIVKVNVPQHNDGHNIATIKACNTRCPSVFAVCAFQQSSPEFFRQPATGNRTGISETVGSNMNGMSYLCTNLANTDKPVVLVVRDPCRIGPLGARHTFRSHFLVCWFLRRSICLVLGLAWHCRWTARTNGGSDQAICSKYFVWCWSNVVSGTLPWKWDCSAERSCN